MYIHVWTSIQNCLVKAECLTRRTDMQFPGWEPLAMWATSCTALPLESTSHWETHNWSSSTGNLAILQHRIKKYIYTHTYQRSFSLILQEIEDGLGRNGEPDGSGCTEHHAVGLAGIRALVDSDSDSNLVQPRKCGPSAAIGGADARAEIGHHPLCKFHHAPLALR